jgi:5-methyltetrahydrofolate--homocysteine methyltransferase
MMGEVSPSQVYEAFSEQARAFQEGGADAVIIETMTDLEEARQAIRAVQSHTDLEIVCSFTFDRTPWGAYRTMMGLSPVQVLNELLNMGISIVGTNCGNGLENMIPIVNEMHQAHPVVPILVNANAGMPIVRQGTVTYPDAPEEMALQVLPVLKAGARIIGGCCGTTPRHITAIQQKVMEFLNPS